MKLISSTLLATLLASTTFAFADNATQLTANTSLERIEVAQSAAADEVKKKAMMLAEEAKKKAMMAAEEEKKAMMMAAEACDAADFTVTGFGNATAAADSIADVVMKIKELSGDESCAIEITGYTSKVGPKSVNMALSEERAEWVKGELMSAGVDLSHTMVKGAGETSQFGNNSSNRRVVISVK